MTRWLDVKDSFTESQKALEARLLTLGNQLTDHSPYIGYTITVINLCRTLTACCEDGAKKEYIRFCATSLQLSLEDWRNRNKMKWRIVPLYHILSPVKQACFYLSTSNIRAVVDLLHVCCIIYQFCCPFRNLFIVLCLHAFVYMFHVMDDQVLHIQ